MRKFFSNRSAGARIAALIVLIMCIPAVALWSSVVGAAEVAPELAMGVAEEPAGASRIVCEGCRDVCKPQGDDGEPIYCGKCYETLRDRIRDLEANVEDLETYRDELEAKIQELEAELAETRER